MELVEEVVIGGFCFFFFKQKTAYEIYQCDWSSDVCSSDLAAAMAEEALASRLESDVAAAERDGYNSARLRRLSRDAFELGRRDRGS